MRAEVASRCAIVLGACATAAVAIIGLSARAGEAPKPTKADPLAVGYEIFNREWMPNDPRAHGGDGLGPAFNDTSCVACHNAGGGGGAGPISKNIDILSASRNGAFMAVAPPPVTAPQPVDPAAGFVAVAAPSPANGAACPPPSASQLEPLVDLHAGFKNGRTVVLHKFGTDPNYEAFRARFLQQQGVSFMPNGNQSPFAILQAPEDNTIDGALTNVNFVTSVNGGITRVKPVQTDARSSAAMARMQQVRISMNSSPAAGSQINVGPFLVSRSQRNPTPLFGLGLIDAIPESAIEAMARRQAREAPEVAGRVARVKDGRVGRLGWKGQTANSEDFVLNACAVELGLEVPGIHQAMTPQAPRYKSGGLDLSAEDCSSLVAYVRSLPRPVERASENAVEAKFLAAGKATFTSIGCASCHTSKLGEVEGLYSDLLIHEMGEEMADSGSYNGSDDGTDEPLVPLAVADNQPQPAPANAREPKGARKGEWRTPPLWGVRDSGPYLHDGRAQTIEQAVAMHGGQGSTSAQKFFLLSPHERLQVEAFLKSLVAPTAPDRRQLARAGN
jgi:CxxC motif-containing protein (DUF1111 family)